MCASEKKDFRVSPSSCCYIFRTDLQTFFLFANSTHLRVKKVFRKTIKNLTKHEGNIEKLKSITRLGEVGIKHETNVAFCECLVSTRACVRVRACVTHLQRDVLEQRVLQHGLQLPIDLQWEVEGQAGVGGVGGVQGGHDAPPPTQGHLVVVGRLGGQSPRLLPQHVALEDPGGREKLWGMDFFQIKLINCTN